MEASEWMDQLTGQAAGDCMNLGKDEHSLDYGN
jgi:hypothetical protein